MSICTICCQTDENVFLICWCFFYLHVFSEVAACWALSATVYISQFLLYIYRVLAWNSCLIGLTQSDLLTSLSPGSWLVFSCISNQWVDYSIFKYLALVCCSSRSTLQKPSTFPSSTCIDLLWGDSCMLYGGYSFVLNVQQYFAHSRSSMLWMYWQ